MTTAAYHLTLVARLWGDLHDTLATPVTATWPPAGLRAYLAVLDDRDDEQPAPVPDLYAPAPIAVTPMPINAQIYDTMQAITEQLADCADAIAEVVQRPPMTGAPAGWPPADRARRDQLAAADRTDPRRWRWTGGRPSARDSALWLLARVQGVGGPFKPLPDRQHQHIAAVARAAAEQVERALDIAAQQRALDMACQCGGRITIHGGSGAHPLAHCARCGTVWSEQGAHAAA